MPNKMVNMMINKWEVKYIKIKDIMIIKMIKYKNLRLS